MVIPTRPPANAFVKVARRIYNPIGFTKGYNFVLYFIFAGALVGFCLARLQFLAFNGIFCNLESTTGSAAPGECYWYSMPRYRIGIIIHLAGILPAGVLAVFQFVPAIRHKYLIYHRVAGYLIILLVFVSIAGAVMITDRSFGGHIATQTAVGALAIASTFGIINAYYNIKRLQIDQHRAWMLRVWFWMASIITLRLIQALSAVIISMYPSGWYQVMPCAELLPPLETVYSTYPVCSPSNSNLTVDSQVIVKANFNGEPEQIGAALAIGFPMAMWLALVMHAVGIEAYLRLTPKEAERLRIVSYKRQLAAGMKNPGNAGLVPEKLGDMELWEPQMRHREDSSETVLMEDETK
ncbi:hypothetical protein N7519_003459 [Penicillium mononematosum]|uniref:uncharacterized protein n=1 Tax=Penicillium mononematosum TaxID=268346 RepID=UPI00254888EC|nr:uncharacterized protein N7519_003459 [Penicillium mononematosum]KAJ6188551.1 hypothetical protein N7519_003459 [Penicillium mononematosum]